MTLRSAWTQANTVQQVYPDTSDEHVSYVMWKCERYLITTFGLSAGALAVCQQHSGTCRAQSVVAGVCTHASGHSCGTLTPEQPPAAIQWLL